MGRGPGFRLLPREALVKTSQVDQADWNYRPLLGWLQRKRFELLLSLMGDEHFGRLLEVGYGSGVLMPELDTRCDELFGVDLHGKHREVGERLRGIGVEATLISGTATRLPFEDDFFDCAVTVSALEYVDDIRAAGSELARVLTPEGVLIVVTPGHSALLDLALRLATGQDAAENYGDRRQRLLPALLERFRPRDERLFPRLVGRSLAVYHALRLSL